MNIYNNDGSEKFAQCEMSREESRTVGYIPAWAAKVGNLVELTDLDGQYWRVDAVGNIISKDKLRVAERGYKEFQGSLVGGGIDE